MVSQTLQADLLQKAALSLWEQHTLRQPVVSHVKSYSWQVFLVGRSFQLFELWHQQLGHLFICFPPLWLATKIFYDQKRQLKNTDGFCILSWIFFFFFQCFTRWTKNKNENFLKGKRDSSGKTPTATLSHSHLLQRRDLEAQISPKSQQKGNS